jgi:hypothetical protein
LPGIKKGGTTSVYNYLIHHPQIKSSVQKEPHYFDFYFDKGEYWYHGNFPIKSLFSKKNLFTCDATPTYIFDIITIERIKKYNPKAKLIFVLRNPKIRSYSEYQYCLKLLYQGKEHSSFEERIENELKWLRENERNFTNLEFINTIPQKARLMGMGLYFVYLQEWFKHFDQNQIFVTTSERLFDETSEVMKEIVEFLGLEPYQYKNLEKFNENKYSKSYDSPTFTNIAEFYIPYNRSLEKLLGRKLNWD